MANLEENIINLKVSDPVEEGDVVTPWTVECQNDAGIDYDKLIGNNYTLHQPFIKFISSKNVFLYNLNEKYIFLFTQIIYLTRTLLKI